MASHNILAPLLQAAFCFAVIVCLRITVVYLGSRLGGILIGTPMLVFPLLAMQAWLGPEVTQAQTFGSISSISAITVALWMMWLPGNFGPLAAVMIMALAWSATLATLYFLELPAAVMAVALVANATLILVRKRHQQPVVGPSKAKLNEAAIPTVVFLIIFFAAKEFVPDFVRGVLAMFPIVMLATIYFVRSSASDEGFRNFIVYSHCAIVATAMFVVALHFTLVVLPIAASFAFGLLVSVVTSFSISRVWRRPKTH